MCEKFVLRVFPGLDFCFAVFTPFMNASTHGQFEGRGKVCELGIIKPGLDDRLLRRLLVLRLFFCEAVGLLSGGSPQDGPSMNSRHEREEGWFEGGRLDSPWRAEDICP